MTAFNIVGIINLIVLIGVIYLSVKYSITIRKKLLRGKKGRWLLAVYTGALLVCTIIFFFMPVSADKQGRTAPDMQDIPDLNAIAEHDVPIEEAQGYKMKEETFEYHKDEIEITFQDDEYLAVLWERSPELDDMIEAAFYMTPLIEYGLDVTTGYVQPPDMHIRDGDLMVQMPEETELNIKGYKEEFPIRQFMEDMWMNDWNPDEGLVVTEGTEDGAGDLPDDEEAKAFGQQLLYLRVPEDMEVKNYLDG